MAHNETDEEGPAVAPGTSSGRSGRTWLTAVVACLVLVVAGQFGKTLWTQAGVANRSKPFISAYMIDPTTLPLSVARGSVIPVTFGLSSHDGAAASLRWRLASDSTSPTTAGTVELPPNGTTSIRVTIAIGAHLGPTRILLIIVGHPALTLRLLTRVTA